MRVSLGDWQRSGVAGSPDTLKGPATRRSPDRGRYRSTRLRNRPCRARLAPGWPEAYRLPPQLRRLTLKHGARRKPARYRRDALHRCLCNDMFRGLMFFY